MRTCTRVEQFFIRVDRMGSVVEHAAALMTSAATRAVFTFSIRVAPVRTLAYCTHKRSEPLIQV